MKMSFDWRYKNILSLTLTAAMIAGCSNSESTAVDQRPSPPSLSQPALKSLGIEDFGPKKTKAGVSFNLQPNGKSAIWIRANQKLDGYDAAIWFDGHRLSDRGIQAGTVTGTVPAELFAKPGTYLLKIGVGEQGEQTSSETVDFVVE